MDKSLFTFLLLTGTITLAQSVPLKYYLILQGKTWTEAQAYCRTFHTDLPTVQNAEDVIKLQNEAQKQQFSSDAWIGLYKEVHEWSWSFRDQPVGTFTKWDGTEPNNSGGRQECAAIKPAGWTDKDCPTKLRVLCFDESKTGTDRYILYSVLMTWYEAQSYCRQHHTDLASTVDQTEYSTVVGKITTDTWIGLYRNSWRWSDQTNVSTIPWASGCPINVWPNGNYGFLHNVFVSDNATNLNVMPFYCHGVITGHQQIIRVKIQSDQNVNDPAVKTLILEKMKEKLKDLGMAENIVMKWREQPGGEVFKKVKKNTTDEEYKCGKDF